MFDTIGPEFTQLAKRFGLNLVSKLYTLSPASVLQIKVSTHIEQTSDVLDRDFRFLTGKVGIRLLINGCETVYVLVRILALRV
jgi:hypothetical protein